MCIGITSMKLTVNRKNVQAINFYFSQGFRIDHAEDFDIGSGYVMNDFVMVKTYSAL
jgi:ribosomal protein S18 acetylase RimI-like enzyme